MCAKSSTCTVLCRKMFDIIFEKYRTRIIQGTRMINFTYTEVGVDLLVVALGMLIVHHPAGVDNDLVLSFTNQLWIPKIKNYF